MSVLDLPTGSLREMLGGEVKEFTAGPTGWYDDKHLLLRNAGFGDHLQLQVFDIDTRHVVRRVNAVLPGALGLEPLVLVSLTGPAPTGAIVI